MGSAISGFVTDFFTYETTKSVVVKSWSVGIINRIVQLLIITYFVCYVFIYEKAYQVTDTGIESSVMTKVKGFGYHNGQVMDVADYVFPSQGSRVFSIMTSWVITENQFQGKCKETVSLFYCTDDIDCEEHMDESYLGNGFITGRCLLPPSDQNGTQSSSDKNGTQSSSVINGTQYSSDINGTQSSSVINGTQYSSDINGTQSSSVINGTQYSSDINGTQSSSVINGTQYSSDINGTQSSSVINGTQYSSDINGTQSSSVINGTQYSSDINGTQSSSVINGTQYSSDINGTQSSSVINGTQYSSDINGTQSSSVINGTQYSSDINATQYSSDINVTQYSSDKNGTQSSSKINGTHRKYVPRMQRKGRCEVQGWCPVENERIKGERMLYVENFTIFIKNSVRFPLFNVTRGNFPPTLTASQLKRCKYDPVTNPLCPIFQVKDILKYIGSDVASFADKGGEIGINIEWKCNLDLDVEKCLPRYAFTQLDLPFRRNRVSKGYNFRFAKYFKTENGTEFRTLHKAFALRFDIMVTGNAGKFSTIPTVINLVAAFTSIGLGTVLCDLILLNFSKGADQYKAKKFEEVSGDGEAIKTQLDATLSQSSGSELAELSIKQGMKSSYDSGAGSLSADQAV